MALIRLEGTLDTVNTVTIQTYSSSTFDVFDFAVKPSIEFGDAKTILYVNQDIIYYGNLDIDQFANNSILEYQTTKFNDEVMPVNLFGNAQLNSIVYPNSITATTAFGTAQFIYNQNILLSDRIEALSSYSIQTYASTSISDVIASLDYSIASSLAFGTEEVEFLIYPNSIDTGVEFGSASISRNIRLNSIDSTLEFGVSRINMEITDVPFPSITSTLVIPQPSVKYIVGPLGIATTANFGIANVIDNIHRLLVFKDGNISKIGDNDAGVIAGGIRLNPASAVSVDATSGNATLPSNPVGFLSVNIDGANYRIPYFNP